jgi:DNA polymerase-3 subunit delta'
MQAPQNVLHSEGTRSCDEVLWRPSKFVSFRDKTGACSVYIDSFSIEKLLHRDCRALIMWQGISGHDNIVERFRQTLAAGRLASTYLFVGPPGIGKRRFALELAHALLCTEVPETALAPCGHCESCRMFAAGNHPDLQVEGLPQDKATLPIELFIGDREHRNQVGLCHQLSMKPFFGRRRVAIVDDADRFSIPSANCLLKTLEEPPPSALLILIGTSLGRQLPTIRSRSQIVQFQPLPNETIADILLGTGVVTDRTHASRVAEFSEGSVERATRLIHPELWEFRSQLISALRATRLDGVRLMRSVQSFVDEAGKEAARRRDRLRIVLGFAIELYRSNFRKNAEFNGSASIASLDACLTALEQIDRNANQGLVIQSWSETLTDIANSRALGIYQLERPAH